MIAAEVVVLEKSVRWSSELHRQFQQESILVRACNDITALRERIVLAQNSDWPCIAVLNLDGWPGECLPVISWLRSLRIPVVIPGFREIELLEPSLRELGMTTFLMPPVAGHGIAEACRRLFDDDSIQFR